jgi:hypothetical protein
MKKEGNGFSYKLDKDIPLILNSYDDIFSNFDPRPYSQRALSKDFILECQKASEDKKGEIELKFLVKKDARNLKEEEIITKRIKDHFRKHFLEKRKELFNLRLIGFIWFLAGCFLIVATTFFGQEGSSFAVRLIIAIAHPAGWFFLWEGMGKIIIHSKEKKAEHVFHKKMNKVKISFLSIK